MQDNRRKANSTAENIPFWPLFFCCDTHPLLLEMAACIRRNFYLHRYVPISKSNVHILGMSVNTIMRRRMTKLFFSSSAKRTWGVRPVKTTWELRAQPGICFLFQNPSLFPFPPSFPLRCKKRDNPKTGLKCNCRANHYRSPVSSHVLMFVGEQQGRGVRWHVA
jgi:hypothetical protein